MQHFVFKGARTLMHKIMLISSFVFTFILGSIGVLYFLFSFLGFIEVEKFLIGDYISLLLFPLSVYILITILKKEGLSFSEDKLYNTNFLFSKPLKSEEINTNNISDICILKFNMAHNTAMGTSVNPDATVTDIEYQICLLNSSHSKRKLIFSTNDSEEAKKIKTVIQKNLGFNFVTYNPPKLTRRKRK